MPYFPPPKGSSANKNLDVTPYYLGFNGSSDGGGTTITANASIHAKGTWQSLGTVSSDIFDVTLLAGKASSSANAYSISLRIAGVVVLSDLFLWPGANAGWHAIPIKLNVAAGSLVEVQIQANVGGSATLKFALSGSVRDITSPPGYASLEGVAPAGVAAQTRASTVDVAASVAATPTFTTLVASTSKNYAGVVLVASPSTSGPVSQDATVKVAVGAAGSEVVIGQMLVLANATDPRMIGAFSEFIQKRIPAGSRLSSCITAAAADTYRVQAFGAVE